LKDKSKKRPHKDSIKSVQKVVSKVPYSFSYSANNKTSYKSISERTKKNIKSILRTGHKVNKSYGNEKKNTKNSRIFRKNHTNYSVYLSKNTENSSEKSKAALDRLNSDHHHYSKNKKFSLNLAVGEIPKIVERSPKTVNTDDGFNYRCGPKNATEKKSDRLLNLTSPSSINTNKTIDPEYIRRCPRIFSYNLNSIKSEFEKVHHSHRKEQKKLGNKLKKLKKKTKSIVK